MPPIIAKIINSQKKFEKLYSWCMVVVVVGMGVVAAVVGDLAIVEAPQDVTRQ